MSGDDGVPHITFEPNIDPKTRVAYRQAMAQFLFSFRIPSLSRVQVYVFRDSSWALQRFRALQPWYTAVFGSSEISRFEAYFQPKTNGFVYGETFVDGYPHPYTFLKVGSGRTQSRNTEIRHELTHVVEETLWSQGSGESGYLACIPGWVCGDPV